MSERYNISRTWKGFSTIRRLVIFGDSYSAVDDFGGKVKPDANKPLGVPFPGITWNEPDMPNWVGHLITEYCPEPRFRPSDAGRSMYNMFKRTSSVKREAQVAWVKSPFLVHDYAKGGEKIPGVRRQIQELFLPGVGTKPDWAAWTATETLFVTWVGINDCAYVTKEGVQGLVEELLSTQNDLYDAGARNLLFIDLPTIHRAPAVRPHLEAVVEEKFRTWNTALRNAVQDFGKNHPDATVLLFSSFEAFDTILNEPEMHGFDPKDVKRFNGSIWMDHIHPTSKVHKYIACRLAAFLESIPLVDSVNTEND